MRFLVDEDVDVRLIRVLRRLGHEARRVPVGVTNGAVIQLARRERRTLITRDTDFTNIERYPPAGSYGIIHLAIHPPWLERLVPPLTHFLKRVPEPALPGTTFVLEEHGYHQLA